MQSSTFFKNTLDFFDTYKTYIDFILDHIHWPFLFLVILAAFIVKKIVEKYARTIIVRTKRTYFFIGTDKQNNILVKPIGLMAFSGAWSLGIHIIGLPNNFIVLFSRFGQILFSVSAVLAAYGVADTIIAYYKKKSLESKNKFDDILVPLVGKTAKFFVIAVGIIFIGDSFALDMKSIIAGLGIGGLAFALAAKDTISNIFGSITVLLDRPFKIGDWILINDKIEGTVEEVGLRSTRIRTFYDSLISVPNGQLTNIHIDNFGKRTYRRYNTKLSIQYDTPPEKIEQFCEAIRQLILKHKWTRKDYFHVYLNNMSASSLDIMLYVFWKVPDWSTELNERHRLLIDIIRLAQELKINFAFPTQTLHMYNEKQDEQLMPHDPALSIKEGAKAANSILSTPFSAKDHRSGVTKENFQDNTIDY